MANHHFFYGQADTLNPTFSLFNGASGVDNLDPSLTINSQTVTPMFRYKGGDANAGSWDAWGYGDNLPIVEGGTDPTLNCGSPLLGASDDAVCFNEGDYYQGGSAFSNAPTTEDLVIELVLRTRDGGTVSNLRVLSWIGTTGMEIYSANSGTLTFKFTNGGSTTWNIGTLGAGRWLHVMLFFNMDEASTNGGKAYVNGVLQASKDISSIGNIGTDPGTFTIGASRPGGVNFDSPIAYLAGWKQSSWHQAGAAGPTEWATIAQDRFNRLIGIHPPKTEGTTVPTIQTRASVAYLDKLEDGNTTRKLYQVGDNWLRNVSRLDSNGDEIQGYLPETAATNLCLQSEDFDTTWVKIDAGDLIADGYTAPNKSTTADGLVPDTTDGQHYIQQAITLTAATYTFSMWAKKGSQDWVGLYQSPGGAGGRYFNLSTGELGGVISGTPIESFIESWGDSWYRVGISFTGTAASHTVRIYPAEADGDAIFAGDGSVSTYMWGAQVELEDYMTSYIPTTTGTVARDDDQLRFLGDDGNLGGVGSELRGTFASKVLLPSYDNTNTRTMLQLSDGGSSADRVVCRLRASNDGLEYLSAATDGNAGAIAGTTDAVDGVVHDIRYTWVVDDATAYLDGVSEGSDTSVDIPNDLDRIDIGLRGAVNQLNGVLSSVKLSNPPPTVGPTFRLFEPDRALGVDMLGPSLTINGQTVTPMFRYKGGDADASGWNAWDYGDNLTLVEDGTDPTYNDGSPLLGPNDDSVLFNEGDYYQGSIDFSNAPTTDDIVIECVLKIRDGGTASNLRIFSWKGTTGMEMYMANNGSSNIFLDDGSDAVYLNIVPDTGSWVHILMFVNKDEASTSGGQTYVNGVALGVGKDFTSVGNIGSNVGKFTIGATLTGVVNHDSPIAYLAGWKQSDWHQAGAAGPTEWATIAAERFHKLTGMWPSRAGGTAAPVLATRATTAYLDKLEDSNTTRKLYQVGSGWLRNVSRLDSNGDEIKGYLVELAVTNLMLYSQDFTNWSQVDGDDLVADGYTAVDKSTTATGFTASATNGSHGVSRNATVTADTYTFSAWVKKGDKDWCRILNATLVIGAYFDLANGVVGTTQGSITDTFIESWGDNWYRCGYSFTGTAASHNFRIYANEADNDTTFAGDGINVNLYMWGAQVEKSEYMTSYIPTTTSTATKNNDILTFKGDNGNLGGVGSELQGTLVMDFLGPDHDYEGGGNLYSLNDGADSADKINANLPITDTVFVDMTTTGGNNGDANASSDIFDGVIHSIRLTWETDDLNIYIDDSLEATDNVCDVPDDLDQIDIGMHRNNAGEPNAVISNIRIFKVPITQG